MQEVQSVINRPDNEGQMSNNEMSAEVAAVMAATKKSKIQETEWFELNGVVVKYKRLPAYIYNKARTHLRQIMRKKKPTPPVVTRGAREMVNKKDPIYKEQLEQWKEEWEALETESFLSTSLLAGLKLKNPIPPDDEWLPDVLEILDALGINTDIDVLFSSFSYSREKIRELYFKEYIVMANHKDMEIFSNYQTEGTLRANEEDLTTQAVDMF